MGRNSVYAKSSNITAVKIVRIYDKYLPPRIGRVTICEKCKNGKTTGSYYNLDVGWISFCGQVELCDYSILF